MGITKKLSSGLRRAFEPKSREHRERTLTEVGPVPRQGAYIAKEDVRVWVNEEITYPLWSWLTLHGWREIDLASDRRRYRAARPSAIDELAFADAAHREAIEQQILENAEMTEFERSRKVQPRKR